MKSDPVRAGATPSLAPRRWQPDLLAARLLCPSALDTSRQNLLDYSLLLGIYRPTDSTLDPASKETFLQDLARQCRGCAFVSHDRQKVYFFGIIDVPPRVEGQGRWGDGPSLCPLPNTPPFPHSQVLEKFNLRWRVQRARATG